MQTKGWVTGLLLAVGAAGGCATITGLDDFEVTDAAGAGTSSSATTSSSSAGAGGSSSSGGGGGGTAGGGGQVSQLDVLNVPVNGESVFSAMALRAGVTYRLRATGEFTTDATTMLQADAEYYDFANPEDFAGPADLGITIDGDMEDGSRQLRWGPYNPEHVYEQMYQGTGNPLQLHYYDNGYGNNQPGATLKVEIIEMP